MRPVLVVGDELLKTTALIQKMVAAAEGALGIVIFCGATFNGRGDLGAPVAHALGVLMLINVSEGYECQALKLVRVVDFLCLSDSSKLISRKGNQERHEGRNMGVSTQVLLSDAD